MLCYVMLCRLVASLCVVGVSTQEPSIQKELTELHKIPTFEVFMGKNINSIKLLKLSKIYRENNRHLHKSPAIDPFL